MTRDICGFSAKFVSGKTTNRKHPTIALQSEGADRGRASIFPFFLPPFSACYFPKSKLARFWARGRCVSWRHTRGRPHESDESALKREKNGGFLGPWVGWGELINNRRSPWKRVRKARGRDAALRRAQLNRVPSLRVGRAVGAAVASRTTVAETWPPLSASTCSSAASSCYAPPLSSCCPSWDNFGRYGKCSFFCGLVCFWTRNRVQGVWLGWCGGGEIIWSEHVLDDKCARVKMEREGPGVNVAATEGWF